MIFPNKKLGFHLFINNSTQKNLQNLVGLSNNHRHFLCFCMFLQVRHVERAWLSGSI